VGVRQKISRRGYTGKFVPIEVNSKEHLRVITPIVISGEEGLGPIDHSGMVNYDALLNQEGNPQRFENIMPAATNFSKVSALPLIMKMLDLSPSALVTPSASVRPAPFGGRFFAGLTFAQNLSYRNIQPLRPILIIPPLLEENESASWTAEAGIRIGFRPSSRFAVSGGLGLYNVGLQSRHRFRVSFDPRRELPSGNGSSESNYAFSVPSAYGDATIEIGLRRPNQQQITPGQNIGVLMQTNLNLRYLSIPVNTYYFASSGKLSLGLKAGMALNVLEKQEFTALVQVLERGLGSRTVTVTPRFDPLEKVIPEIQFGAAVWYRPSIGWMLSLEPSYRKSLKPAATREFFSVSQYAWGIQLGLQKFF